MLHQAAQEYANKFLSDRAGPRIDEAIKTNPDWDVNKWHLWWNIELKRQQNDFDKSYKEYRRRNL